MRTLNQMGEILEEQQASVQKLPLVPDDMATITVRANFDWKFWAALMAGGIALYILSGALKRNARHG